tara:strand:+ start:1380 stop:1799 length:420 start_codon:yes stop_codon:yes gene_type:complete
MNDQAKIGTIMLVDDDKVDQMMYKRVINRSGLVGKIIPFQYPDEALAYLKTPDCDEIDVLLLDINMPRLTGFEFLERAIAEVGPAFAKVVVVMLTTSLDPSDKKRAASFSIVKAFHNKPITVEDLVHISSLPSEPKSGA